MNTRVPRPWFAAIAVFLAISACSCRSYGSGGGGYPIAPNTSRELDSGDLLPGATFQHRFAAAGTYAYHCIYHDVMTGNVQVNASAADSIATVNIVSATTSFASATVRPGGRVIWTNNTTMRHTVTSD